MLPLAVSYSVQCTNLTRAESIRCAWHMPGDMRPHIHFRWIQSRCNAGYELITCIACKLTRVEGIHDCIPVNDAGSGSVHQESPLLHAADAVFVEHLAGTIGERDQDGDGIRRGQQLIKLYPPASALAAGLDHGGLERRLYILALFKACHHLKGSIAC